MRALLDTHTFLWWVVDAPELSRAARETIGGGGNDIFFSVVSAWEIVIKFRLGQLEISESASAFLIDQVSLNGFGVLPIEMTHALQIQDLPSHHRDPFDRMLVAQSLVENMPLITCDKCIAAYDAPIIW